MLRNKFLLYLFNSLTFAFLQLFFVTAAAGSVILPNFKTYAFQVPFIVNEGQLDKDVAFYIKAPGRSVFVTREGEVVYALGGSGRCLVLTESFPGGLESPISGGDQGGAHVTYYQGSDPSRWREEVGTFLTVNLGRKYKLIDIQLEAVGEQ